MTERTTAHELRNLGFDALVRAAATCGVQIEAAGSADEEGLVLVVNEGRLGVLVADQISAGLRAELNRVGVGWLTRWA